MPAVLQGRDARDSLERSRPRIMVGEIRMKRPEEKFPAVRQTPYGNFRFFFTSMTLVATDKGMLNIAEKLGDTLRRGGIVLSESGFGKEVAHRTARIVVAVVTLYDQERAQSEDALSDTPPAKKPRLQLVKSELARLLEGKRLAVLRNIEVRLR